MKRVIIGLGIGGLLALVVGLILPHLPDSAVRNLSQFFPFRYKVTGDPSFQGLAVVCPAFFHPSELGGPPATTSWIARHALMARSCATASDVMNLGAWLVVLGAVALVIAVAVLIRGRIRRHPAMNAQAA